jgi:hypothetical protein
MSTGHRQQLPWPKPKLHPHGTGHHSKSGTTASQAPQQATTASSTHMVHVRDVLGQHPRHQVGLPQEERHLGQGHHGLSLTQARASTSADASSRRAGPPAKGTGGRRAPWCVPVHPGCSRSCRPCQGCCTSTACSSCWVQEASCRFRRLLACCDGLHARSSYLLRS